MYSTYMIYDSVISRRIFNPRLCNSTRVKLNILRCFNKSFTTIDSE